MKNPNTRKKIIAFLLAIVAFSVITIIICLSIFNETESNSDMNSSHNVTGNKPTTQTTTVIQNETEPETETSFDNDSMPFSEGIRTESFYSSEWMNIYISYPFGLKSVNLDTLDNYNKNNTNEDHVEMSIYNDNGSLEIHVLNAKGRTAEDVANQAKEGYIDFYESETELIPYYSIGDIGEYTLLDDNYVSLEHRSVNKNNETHIGIDLFKLKGDKIIKIAVNVNYDKSLVSCEEILNEFQKLR